MAQLPIPGADAGTWGSILNDFLEVSHNSDGTLLTSALQRAGAITSSSSLGGDLSGTPLDATVARISGVTLPASLPTAGDVLIATGSSTTSWGSTPAGIDWLNVKNYGAQGNGTNDDTSAINTALRSAVPGQTVYLPAGVYRTTAPIVIPPFIVLRGSRGAIAAADVQNQSASVLQPAGTWSSSLPMSGVITLLDTQASGFQSYSGLVGGLPGVQIRDLIIDGSLSPASIDGIASYGSVAALRVDGVGMNLITGNGFNAEGNPNDTPSELYADGWHISHCILQNITGNGFYGNNIFNDSTLYDVHVQAAGGDGFTIRNGNTYMANCRADFCANGFTIDFRVGLAAGWGAFTLSGCGTEENKYNGLNVINSSTYGNASGSFLTVNGCIFQGDGVNSGAGGGGYAGISVGGRANVSITNSFVGVSTSQVSGGSPEYALATATMGNGNVPPMSITVDGGILTGASGVINDAAPATYLNVGPNVITNVGSSNTSVTSVPYLAKLNGQSLAIQSGAVAGNIVKVTGTTAAPNSSLIEINTAAAADNSFGIDVTGDTANRFKMDSNGKFYWGPGNATQDTDLYRTAAGTLQTDGAIQAPSSYISAQRFTAGGLTGATAASRYVGATASGAPTTGTFNTGDFVVDQTGKIWVCTAAGSPGTWQSSNASAPLSLLAAESGGEVLTVTNTTAGPTNSNIEIITAAAADNSFGIEVTGDTANRFKIDSNGKVYWGPGNTTQDTDLYRTGVGTLQSDGSMQFPSGYVAANHFNAYGITGATAASRYVGATTSGAPTTGTFDIGDYVIDQTGSLWICTAAGSPGTWQSSNAGAPLSLTAAESAGQVLTVTNTTSAPTDSSLEIVAAAAADNSFGIEVTGDTANRFKIDSNGKLYWGSGSTNQDTDLYRTAASILQTDGAIQAPSSYISAQRFTADGLTGATAASRYVGATTSGAPITGSFNTGDFVVDQSGKIWVCTAAGSPGTWSAAGSGVTLDGIATDIQPLGTQAAGSTGKASDAGHVHPATSLNLTVGSSSSALLAGGSGVMGMVNATTAPSSTPSGGGVFYAANGQPTWLDSNDKLWNMAQPLDFQPQDGSFLAWTYDPALSGQQIGATNNTIQLFRVNIRVSITVTNITLWIDTAGTGLVTSENFAGLYNSSGTLIGATVDQTTNWATGGTKTMALSGGPYAVSAGYVWVAVLSNESSGSTPKFGALQNFNGTITNMGMSGTGNMRCATNATATTLPSTLTLSSNLAAQTIFWAGLS